jgi:phage terminase large subunit
MLDSTKIDRAWDQLRAVWRTNPVSYFIERLGIIPTVQQRQMLTSLVPPGAKVSVRAGHGVGKSTCLAGAIWWVLECFDYPKIPCTAPTASQLRDVLWAELAKLMRLSDLRSAKIGVPPNFYLSKLFHINQEKAFDIGAPDEWFAVARTARKETPDALQGFHASAVTIAEGGMTVASIGDGGQILFVIDEASGVADEIFQAAEGALSSHGARLVMAGNPLRNTGYFAASHKQHRSEYTALHFRSQDSPLVDPSYRSRLVRKFGDGSNVVRVRADGEFPRQDDDVLISLEDAEAALTRADVVVQPNERRILGIDVARYGDDRTVYILRCGPSVEFIEVRAKENLMQTTGRAMVLWHELSAAAIHVDATGMGAGVCDRLREQGAPVVDVNVGEAAPPREGFRAIRGEALPYKLRDYLWIEMARWMREAKPSFVMAPKDHAEDLAGELCSVTYALDSSGRIVAEPKSEMKKRGLRSPDLADALGVTFAPGKRANKVIVQACRGGF